MSESEETPPEAYRPAQPMRAAQHKFLLLGAVLAILIGAALVWLNEAAKQENKYQQALDMATRTQVTPHVNSAGLGYQSAAPAPPPKPANVVPSTKLPKTSSHAPTNPVPPAE